VHDRLLGSRQTAAFTIIAIRIAGCPRLSPAPRSELSRDRRDAAHGTCKIIPTDTYDLDAAHPAYVNPIEPVHEVMNLAEFNQRAVSIHIYSKPFDSCEVYLRDQAPTRMSAVLHQRITQTELRRKTLVVPGPAESFL